jgi:hypothetical protein
LAIFSRGWATEVELDRSGYKHSPPRHIATCCGGRCTAASSVSNSSTASLKRNLTSSRHY